MRLVFLKNDADFAYNRFKKSINSASFRIRTALRNQNQPRFGFIIPKKVLNKATDRNKIKRRLKSLFFKHQTSIKPLDILVLPNASSLKKSFTILETELITALKNLRAWK